MPYEDSNDKDVRQTLTNEDFIRMVNNLCRDFKMLLIGLEIVKDDFTIALRRI